MPRDRMSVLYTSLERDGALAEICFHLAQLDPLPSKPIVLHKLQVEAPKTLRLTYDDFPPLRIDRTLFGDLKYKETEAIGDTIAFLEFDAMIVPSARWPCDNLVLFFDNQDVFSAPEIVESQEIEWTTWARDNGILA